MKYFRQKTLSGDNAPPKILLFAFCIYIIGVSLFSDYWTSMFRICSLCYGIICLVYIFKTRKKVIIDKFSGSGIVFLCWFVLTGIWQKTIYLYSSRLITMILIIAFCVLTIQWLENKKAIICAYRCIIFSNIVVAIIMGLSGQLKTAAVYEKAGSIVGANGVAIIFVFCYCLTLHMSAERKNKKYYLLSIVFATVALLTGSRKAVIGLLVATLLSLLFQAGTVGKKIKNLLLFALFAMAFYFALTQIDAFSYTNQRFQLLLNYKSNNTIDYSSQFRDMYREFGWKAFSENPIIGYGVGYSTMANGVYLHDNYVEIAVSFGLVGLLIFYYRHFVIMSNTLKYKGETHSEKALFISSLVICCIIDYGAVTYFDKFVWLYLAVLYRYSTIMTNELKTGSAFINIDGALL